MYIRYDNKLYSYRNLRDCNKIVTRKVEKSNETFYKHRSVWVKVIENIDKNIEDIFDLKFYVEWDSGIENTPSEWYVQHSKGIILDNKMKLYFAQGHLPGWNVEEKTICSNIIDINEVEKYIVQYEYFVKKGRKLEEKEIDRQYVIKEEFIEKFNQYLADNI